ncbi:uncharacterized protein LOC144343750 [Saccoglossus kowalevskii]
MSISYNDGRQYVHPGQNLIKAPILTSCMLYREQKTNKSGSAWLKKHVRAELEVTTSESVGKADQHYEVEISGAHNGLPQGAKNLYVLSKRFVLCSIYEKPGVLPCVVLDTPLNSFDLSYTQGDSVYVLKLRGHNNKMFIHTYRTDDSEKISQVFDQRRFHTNINSERLRVCNPPSADSCVLNSQNDGPYENSFKDDCIQMDVKNERPLCIQSNLKEQCHSEETHLVMQSAQQVKNPLKVKVAVFAGRPCLGGRWIIEMYIVHPKRDPMQLRDKIMQIRTSRDHIVLFTRLIEVYDSLHLRIPYLEDGWTFQCDSQSKASPGELLSIHDDIINSIIERGNNHKPGWLSYEKMIDLSQRLNYTDEGGWKRLLVDYVGYDFMAIDDIEMAHVTTGKLPAEFVLRLWYETKPEEFTKTNVCKVFCDMGRLDLVRILSEDEEDRDNSTIDNEALLSHSKMLCWMCGHSIIHSAVVNNVAEEMVEFMV